MKITVVCHFDLCAAFGIDDGFVDLEMIDKIKEIKIDDRGFIVKNVFSTIGKTMHNKDSSEYWPSEVGLRLPMGYGIVIELSDEFVSYWKKTAIEFIDIENSEWEGYDFFGIDKNNPDDMVLHDKIMEDVTNCKMVNAYLTVYPSGIAYISLQVDNVNNLENVINVFRCFERTGYNKISGTLISFSKELINCFGNISQLQTLTARGNLDEIIEKSDFFPGFTLLLTLDRSANIENVISEFTIYECLPELEKVITDEATVWVGWKSIIILPDGDTEKDILYNEQASLELIKACIVIYGTTSEYQKLFSKLYTDILKMIIDKQDKKSQIEKKKNCDISPIYDEKSLNLIFSLCMNIYESTNFALITESSSNIAVFNAFDKHAKINDKRNSIRSMAEIFVRNHNQIIEVAKRDRAERLNRYVLIFTILTLVSVVADSLGILDRLKLIITDNMIISIVFSSFIFSLFIIWRLFLKMR